MTPDGLKPMKNKIYYDVLTWFVTQLAFSFTTTPFILLSIHDSLLAWARVYFYCIVGVAACSVFLITPGKPWLQKQIRARSVRPSIRRMDSPESVPQPNLGIPNEPGREFDEMVDEIIEEVKKRREGKVGPDGLELRHKIEETLKGTLEAEQHKKQ
jgi:lysophospholipid acyltransferase